MDSLANPTRWCLTACSLGALAAIAPPVAEAGPTSGGTRLGVPVYDAAHHALVLPYEGPAPAFGIGSVTDPPLIFLTLEGSAAFVGVREGHAPGHDLLRGWLAVGRSAHRVDLVLMLSRSGAVDVRIDRARHRLVLVPRDAGVTRILPVPADVPSPAPSPSPTPSPVTSVAPSPLPEPSPEEPAPSPTPRSGPEVRLGLQAHLVDHQERFDGAHLAAGASSLPGYGVLVLGGGSVADDRSWLEPAWRGQFGLNLIGYAFDDPDGLAVRHVRQEWQSTLQATRRVPLGPLSADVGLGYFLRRETALHIGTGTGSGYAFASGRTMHAPELVTVLRLGPTPSWRGLRVGLGGEAAYAPWVFTAVHDAAASLPAIGALRLGARFDVWLGPARLGLGFRSWSFDGAGYHEGFQGPMVTLDFEDDAARE